MLPPLRGRGLDGREYDLPGDLTAQHTLLVVAFRREQQALVDTWLGPLLEFAQAHPDVAVFELPVISAVYRPVRRFIDGGMVRGIGDPVACARTITIYTDVGRVVRGLDLGGTDTIAVLLVERGGRVLACETGPCDERPLSRLLEALPASARRAV